jgi:hypothetical protein
MTLLFFKIDQWMEKYLIRSQGLKQKAHFWDRKDTICCVWSTGGTRPTLLPIHDGNRGHIVCCQQKLAL